MFKYIVLFVSYFFFIMFLSFVLQKIFSGVKNMFLWLESKLETKQKKETVVPVSVSEVKSNIEEQMQEDIQKQIWVINNSLRANKSLNAETKYYFDQTVPEDHIIKIAELYRNLGWVVVVYLYQKHELKTNYILFKFPKESHEENIRINVENEKEDSLEQEFINLEKRITTNE